MSYVTLSQTFNTSVWQPVALFWKSSSLWFPVTVVELDASPNLRRVFVLQPVCGADAGGDWDEPRQSERSCPTNRWSFSVKPQRRNRTDGSDKSFALMSVCCVRLSDNRHHDFGLETTSTGRKESGQVPVRRFVSRTHHWMHDKMVSPCNNTQDYIIVLMHVVAADTGRVGGSDSIVFSCQMMPNSVSLPEWRTSPNKMAFKGSPGPCLPLRQRGGNLATHRFGHKLQGCWLITGIMRQSLCDFCHARLRSRVGSALIFTAQPVDFLVSLLYFRLCFSSSSSFLISSS